jgi:hypothetical protein
MSDLRIGDKVFLKGEYDKIFVINDILTICDPEDESNVEYFYFFKGTQNGQPRKEILTFNERRIEKIKNFLKFF